MKKLTAAVIGVGHLGRFHAEKYAQLGLLKAIVDCEENRAKQWATKLGCDYYLDYQELLGKVDLVSIVVPTLLHHQISCDFLKAGSHCLVEKPMAINCTEAEEMIAIAARKSLILQIGHIERFNPTFQQFQTLCQSPEYISMERLFSFNQRSTDINVVLDLMVHDLDLLFHLVQSPIKHMQGAGQRVLSDQTDVAHTYIVFANGCIANVSASRVSRAPSRMIRVFQKNCYVSANMKDQKLTVITKNNNNELEEQKYDCQKEEDALLAEIKAFVKAAETSSPPLVSGEDGMRSLAAALSLNQLLKKDLKDLNHIEQDVTSSDL